MKTITFYLDFVSPYAWLAFERLPDALEGLSYSVDYRPVLLGALLQRHGNLGPRNRRTSGHPCGDRTAAKGHLIWKTNPTRWLQAHLCWP